MSRGPRSWPTPVERSAGRGPLRSPYPGRVGRSVRLLAAQPCCSGVNCIGFCSAGPLDAQLVCGWSTPTIALKRLGRDPEPSMAGAAVAAGIFCSGTGATRALGERLSPSFTRGAGLVGRLWNGLQASRVRCYATSPESEPEVGFTVTGVPQARLPGDYGTGALFSVTFMRAPWLSDWPQPRRLVRAGCSLYHRIKADRLLMGQLTGR
jgi:hypothetical protein